MSGRLAGKVCIVTGTGGSMGRATALAFAREGAKVVGCDVTVEPAEATLEMVRSADGEMVSLHPCVLTDPADCAKLVDLAVSEFGRIDVLFNLAARTHFSWLEDVTDDDWAAARSDEVDLVLYLTRAAWPHLKSTHGVVVNMASLNGSLSFRLLPSLAHTTNKAAIQPTGSRRSAGLPVPAAAVTLAAFAANGLFAGLSGLFLSTTLHHPSHALSGATLFLVFSSGVVSQLATSRLQASRVLALGTLSMLVGLVLVVVAVRLSTPNLAMFLIGGALIGAGAGAVFKGTTGIVLEASAPEDRVAMTSALLIALFVGLSVPVIGAGIALNEGASAPDTVLGFAILVALGVSVSGWALLGRRPRTG